MIVHMTVMYLVYTGHVIVHMTGIYLVYTRYMKKRNISGIPGIFQSYFFKKKEFTHNISGVFFPGPQFSALDYTWNIPGIFLKC